MNSSDIQFIDKNIPSLKMRMQPADINRWILETGRFILYILYNIYLLIKWNNKSFKLFLTSACRETPEAVRASRCVIINLQVYCSYVHVQFFLSLNRFGQNILLKKIKCYEQAIEDSIGYD